MTQQKHEKKSRNYYKISTIILASFLVLAILCYGGNAYLKSFEMKTQMQAQQEVLADVISSVQSKGYLEIKNTQANQSLVLVPYDQIQAAQQDVMKQVVSQVQSKGFVVIKDNSSQMILVPYQGNLTQQG